MVNDQHADRRGIEQGSEVEVGDGQRLKVTHRYVRTRR
jgi:hypothetical protein